MTAKTLTKTDVFYEGRFMGSFGSPWINHSVHFHCYFCGREFAFRRVEVKRKFWDIHSFDRGVCAKCAKEWGEEFQPSSLVFFRCGGEMVHPFECELLDCVQFIYEAECLLGVPDEPSFTYCGGNKPIAELDFAACTEGSPYGGFWNR